MNYVRNSGRKRQSYMIVQEPEMETSEKVHKGGKRMQLGQQVTSHMVSNVWAQRGLRIRANHLFPSDASEPRN